MHHQDLPAEKWLAFSIEEQLANIGSEIARALNWRQKNNEKFAQKANERALELFDLSLQNTDNFPRLRELCRTRELWLDYFTGANVYRQNERQWQHFVNSYTIAANIKRTINTD